MQILWAAREGDNAAILSQLQSGAAVDARDADGRTPLMCAIEGRVADVSTLQLLIEHGADVNAVSTRFMETPLRLAAWTGRADLVQFLLASGADLNAQDRFGTTALGLAISEGAADCVKVLLDAGAPLRNPNGSQVIADATHAEVVRILVAAGADIDAKEPDDSNILDSEWPLLTAAEDGDEQLVLLCLELGADPNREFAGGTALHKAAARDHLGIVQLLLAHGADPNASDCDMYTPIMYANSLECVELLLAYGADINAFDCTGAKVIQHHRNPEILDRLVAAGGVLESPPDSLNSMVQTAAQEGALEHLDYLLRHGIDVNVPTLLQMTPLMAAAERGHIDVLRRLIAVGADLHAREYRGRTALFYAVAPETGIAFQASQEVDKIKPAIMDELLAQFPANIRESIENIQVPIPAFGYRPSDDVAAIDLLVQAGAELDPLDLEGATPLLVACGCGRPSRVARLLQLGADVGACDASGRSARDMAAEHPDAIQRELILLLLDAGH